MKYPQLPARDTTLAFRLGTSGLLLLGSALMFTVNPTAILAAMFLVSSGLGAIAVAYGAREVVRQRRRRISRLGRYQDGWPWAGFLRSGALFATAAALFALAVLVA
ncbi:MAG: hypothetical protein O2895_04750 [Chloroflexi bacterium]|nr:hypothetical protein [Chloroflexota bacterium]